MKLILFIIAIYPLLSTAAPIPATSSSMALSKHHGLYISKYNFKIHTDNTLWENIGSPMENSNILTLFKEPKSDKKYRAAMTVRTDRLAKRMSLVRYMNRWKKDYRRFGFSIIKNKRVRIGKNIGYLLDLVNSSSDKQLRQVVFLKSKRAVILTCRGLKTQFTTTAKSCNTIFKNFSWL